MIFKNELKRIFRPASLIIIAVLTLLWYLAFMTGFNLYLDSNLGYPYSIAKEYSQKFGSAIDATELKQVKSDYDKACRERDKIFNQYLGKYGIHSLDEYDDYKEKYDLIFGDVKSEEHKNALARWGEAEYKTREQAYNEINTIYQDKVCLIPSAFKAQSIGTIIDRYEERKEEKIAFKNNDDDYFFSSAKDNVKETYKKMLDEETEISLLNILNPIDSSFDNGAYSYWNILILMCCAIIILPYLVKNNINNITALQYASQKGKKVISTQLKAALTASAILALILIGIFQIFYLKDDTSFLFHSKINSAHTSRVLWIDLTYLQYMILSWCETFVMSLCATLVMFWISYYSRNYVTAIAASVPVIAVFDAISKNLNSLLRMFDYPRFMFPLCFSATIIIVIVVIAVIKHKAMKADYLIN